MANWEGSVTSPAVTGKTVDLMGMTLTFRLRGKETGRRFSITEAVMLPGAGPRFLHAHPASETIIVIEGELEMYGRKAGKKVSVRAGPGTIHHVAAHAPHGVKNVGSTAAKVLVLCHPADIQEAFWEEMGSPTTAAAFPTSPITPDLEKLQRLRRKHGIVSLESPG